MLVPFALDPAALRSSGADDAQVRARHERLLTLWRDVGVFVHGGTELGSSGLLESIDRLPGALKVLWQHAIMELRSTGSDAAWRPPESIRGFADLAHCAQYVKVMGLAAEDAWRIGVAPDGASVQLNQPQMEVCRADLMDQARTFQAAILKAKGDIPKGIGTDAVWRDWFGGLLEWCGRNVTIVDRYAVEKHRRLGPRSGLAYLIKKLRAHPRSMAVTLFSAWPDEVPSSDVIAALRRLVPSGSVRGIDTVNLYSCSVSQFGRVAHDRFIRFGNTVATLDTGLEVLERPIVARHCSFVLKHVDDVVRDKERQLRQVCKFITIR